MNLPTYYRGAGILFFAADQTGTTRVLLGRRLFRPYAGYWSIPGGQMEAADAGDFRRTACRETFEETVGIRKLKSIQHLLQCRVDQAPEHRIHVPFCFDFRVYPVQLKQIPDRRLWPSRDIWLNEFAEWGWFSSTELPQPLHPGLRRAIRPSIILATATAQPRSLNSSSSPLS